MNRKRHAVWNNPNKQLSAQSFGALLVFILSTFFSFGQHKFERESRIPSADLPEFAKKFETTFDDAQRIKWYLEEGLERKNIEAKYKRNGKRFSVEFDTLGTLEDVEIQVKLSELSSEVKKNLTQTFERDSDKYTIHKIQIQYSGAQPDLEKIAQSAECSTNCSVRYEVVVRMKRTGKLTSFEYLFDAEGMLIKRSEIVIQTASNLEY